MISCVAIEATSASSGGAIRFLSQICPALNRANREITYYLLNRSEQRSQLPSSLPENFQWIKIPDATNSVPLRLLWLQAKLPGILKSLRADVLLAASDVSTLRPPCPMVLMVHNINPFALEREQIWRRRRIVRMAVHRKLIQSCARRSSKLIFVSDWSRQAILPYLDTPLQNTAVVHHGVDDVFRNARATPQSGDEPRFILVVSEVLEHKNLTRLVEAYCRIALSLDGQMQLVVAGTITSQRLHQQLERYLMTQGLLEQVKFLGYVPQDELVALYHKAELLVFPSLGETFGLPLVEAMAAGLPVVASDIPLVPEICGDAVCYFDPLDVDDITRSLARMLGDPDLRTTLIQHGLERAKAFSWSDAALSLLSIMDEVSNTR